MGILPPIWREILVPSFYSFWDLHVAIQGAMGWLDYHLHEFRVQDPLSAEEIEIGIPDEEYFGLGAPILAGWEFPIASYLDEPGQTANYEHDFGDGWEHQILLKEIVRLEQDASYPLCVGGERVCPPEDCGGIFGYQTLLEVIDDPAHEDHRQMMQWLGRKFDPELFDSAKIKFDDPEQRWKRAFEC